ncbi:hypothetical protein RFI02_11285 [Acinetobacter sichuanensis]|uniref:phage tail terminator protein n=1 Tax=Acinetobacter sichuanensis TaxID=2136183 RepID=UPI00280D4C4F|nr:hypothetical protein [Acinetobacter sichuanensis]MDQ9021691.1 hypothetical protein [Acinetobacter sichuanensis]
MLNDYFALEDEIKKRIEIEVPDIGEVLTPFFVESLFSMSPQNTAVAIIYVGDRVGESVANGRGTTVHQQWLVVLMIYDPTAQSGQTSNIRKLADPHIRNILKAMQGFRPNLVGVTPFVRVSAGVNFAGKAGRVYFPFLFESSFKT